MFKLTPIPLEKIQLRDDLKDAAAGAFACFEGRVRDHHDGKKVTHLEYEAQETLCQKEAKKIFEEARAQYPIMNLRCYHRTGRLEIGEMAVWVGVLAAHRDAAFKACRYIIDELKTRLPIWKKEFYKDGTSVWVEAESRGHEKRARRQDDVPGPMAPGPHLSEQDYYSRQINLPEIGPEGQRKLKEARVLIVGAGGLGCPALMSLSGAGVGTIGICEHDKVELSNLHRQFLFSVDDVGRPKVQVAKDKINALNPSVTVNEHHEQLNIDNVERMLEKYEIVLDCTDNIKTKYLLNDACFLRQKTLIQAGVYQWEGQLRVMLPGQKGCLRCLWPSVPLPGCVGNCADGGVLGVIPNIFGHLQAMEAVRIILKMENVFENELLILNVADFHIRRLKIKPEPTCPLCSTEPAINAIAPEHYEPQATYLLDMNRLKPGTIQDYVWVDVRELPERQTDPLTEIKSEHMPVSQFTQENIPFSKDKKYLLFCAQGIRSVRLAQMAREMGFENVFSIKDGLPAIRRNLKETAKE